MQPGISRSPALRHALPLVLLLLALALAGARRAPAEDPKKEPTAEEKLQQAFAAKRRDVARRTATARVEAADFCFGKKLFEVSALEYGLALQLDPENSRARERLGFKKVAGKWEEKPSGAAKIKNECPPDEVNNISSELRDRSKKPFAKAADEWFELGKWARERKLIEEEAKSAFREAIGFLPDHAKAREALGFAREGDKWVSADDRAAAGDMKKKVGAAKDGDEVKEETEEEKAVGAKLAKRRSPHFLIQGAFSQDDVKTWTRLAETVFDEFHALLEVPTDKPVIDEPIRGTLLDTQAQHAGYVDKMMEGSPGQKDWYKKGGGQWLPSPPSFEGWPAGQGKESLPDMTVHMSVHVLFQYYMAQGANNVAPWLYESMAYLFTVRLERTALTHCITQSTGGGGKEGMPHDAGHWKESTRASVQKGGDPPIGRMLSAGINSIQGDLLLKGWSMIDWWLATRKADFLKFLAALRESAPGSDAQLAAWKTAFGCTPEESEAEWRKWVQANY